MGTVEVGAARGDGTSAVTAEDIAGELAWCLRRFLEATADEPVMQRAKESLASWERLSGETETKEIDLTLVFG